MRAKVVCLAGVVALLGFVFTGVASADMTLGLTTQPSGSGTAGCTGGNAPFPTLVQSAQDPTTPYFAPTDGAITQWQTNVTGDTPGAFLTFAVVRPAPGGYTVVGADNETVPSPLPAGGVATYTLSSPILVDAGDTLALYSASPGVTCLFGGGSTPSGDNVVSVNDASPPPSAGQALSAPVTCNQNGGCTLDVAATLATTQDAGVTTSAAPANATAGNPALLSSTVTNGGPAVGSITFSDTVPAGLAIDAVAAGSGACTTTGQQVTCTISGLGVGQSAPVDIVVTPTAAGSYANGASVAVGSPFTDPHAANNTASTSLTVRAPVTPPPLKCAVPKLKGLGLPFAKHLLHLLNCTAGRVRHVHSRSVHKGEVIRTSPGAGTYAAGQKVALVVSSGPPKKKHYKR